MVWDSGDGVSRTVPFYERKALLDTILRLDSAGRNLTEYWWGSSVVEEFFYTATKREFVRDVKDICATLSSILIASRSSIFYAHGEMKKCSQMLLLTVHTFPQSSVSKEKFSLRTHRPPQGRLETQDSHQWRTPEIHSQVKRH